MKDTQQLPANKPRIAKEAAQRIRAMVREIEALQKKYAVEIAIQDDAIAFRDMRRTGDWNGYGDWDAFICDAELGRFRARNVVIEDFDGWAK